MNGKLLIIAGIGWLVYDAYRRGQAAKEGATNLAAVIGSFHVGGARETVGVSGYGEGVMDWSDSDEDLWNW